MHRKRIIQCTAKSGRSEHHAKSLAENSRWKFGIWGVEWNLLLGIDMWNLECGTWDRHVEWNLELGTDIWNGIWNLGSTCGMEFWNFGPTCGMESGIWNLESGIGGKESVITDLQMLELTSEEFAFGTLALRFWTSDLGLGLITRRRW